VMGASREPSPVAEPDIAQLEDYSKAHDLEGFCTQLYVALFALQPQDPVRFIEQQLNAEAKGLKFCVEERRLRVGLRSGQRASIAAYRSKHNLDKVLQLLLSRVALSTPKDPFNFLSEFLRTTNVYQEIELEECAGSYAVRIQSSFRGKTSRNHVAKIRAEKNEAATKLQSKHRQKQATRHVEEVRQAKAQEEAQRAARAALERENEQRWEAEAAARRQRALEEQLADAVLVQALGAAATRLAQQRQREQDQAAVKLQSAQRGKTARRRCDRLKKEKQKASLPTLPSSGAKASRPVPKLPIEKEERVHTPELSSPGRVLTLSERAATDRTVLDEVGAEVVDLVAWTAVSSVASPVPVQDREPLATPSEDAADPEVAAEDAGVEQAAARIQAQFRGNQARAQVARVRSDKLEGALLGKSAAGDRVDWSQGSPSDFEEESLGEAALDGDPDDSGEFVTESEGEGVSEVAVEESAEPPEPPAPPAPPEPEVVVVEEEPQAAPEPAEPAFEPEVEYDAEAERRAVQIQATFRGKQGRERAVRYKHDVLEASLMGKERPKTPAITPVQAAIRLQKVFRGGQARQRVAVLKTDRLEEMMLGPSTTSVAAAPSIM